MAHLTSKMNSDSIGPLGPIGAQVDGPNDDIDDVVVGYDDPNEDHNGGDIFNSSTDNVQRRSEFKCPLCNTSTKMHKSYHMATKHFKEKYV